MAYAHLGWGILREMVKDGMEHARKQGRIVGRPSIWTRRGLSGHVGDILERLATGSISHRQAGQELGIGYATLKRLLDARAQEAG